MLFDVGRSLNLFLGDRYLQLVGAQLDPGKWHKGQVSPDESLLDRRKLRLVGLHVDVHVLKLADLLARDVHQQLAVPVSDIERCLAFIVIHFVSHLSLRRVRRSSLSSRERALFWHERRSGVARRGSPPWPPPSSGAESASPGRSAYVPPRDGSRARVAVCPYRPAPRQAPRSPSRSQPPRTRLHTRSWRSSVASPPRRYRAMRAEDPGRRPLPSARR